MNDGSQSPCVGVCRIDPRDGLCEGCARTLAEIAAWRDLDQRARQAIMADLGARRGSLTFTR